MADEIKSNKNYGLDLLRVWLSIEVVFDHYWCAGGPKGEIAAFFSRMRAYAVPCFMVLTFFLTTRHFEAVDGAWVKKRFKRLFVPYLFWPVVAFLLMWLGSTYSTQFVDTCTQLVTFKYYKTPIEGHITDLLWQWAFGSSRRNCMQLWFHADLIILTGFIFLLMKTVSQKFRTHAIIICMALGLLGQYTGFCYRHLNDLPFECKYTLGRLAPCMVFAGIGLFFGKIRGKLDALSTPNRWFISIMGLFLWLFTYYGHWCVAKGLKSLGYYGMHLDFCAIGAVAFFYFLPIEKLPQAVLKVVSLIAKYCMGIYCCHFAFGWALYSWVFPHIGIGRETLASNFAIWGLSWLLCWLISLIPGRFGKDLVE